MPALIGTVTYNTTQQTYGTACLAAGAQASSAGAMPAGGTFRVRVNARLSGTGTLVVASAANMFWMGQDGNNFATANIGTNVFISTTKVINDGADHAYDLRVSAAGVAFYVDGVLAGSSATSSSALGVSSAAGDFYLGVLFQGSFGWNGTIDEVAVSTVIPAAGSYTPAVISNMETGLVALWHLDSNLTDSAGVAPPATAATLTGPTTGASGAASTNFTVGANGAITGTVIITPSAGAGGGTFTPATVSISSGTPTGTFTYTPASVGTKSVSITNNGGLTNPAAIAYVASSSSATAVTMAGPSSGGISSASTNFTVGANGTITGTVVVTPSDSAGGGTFTPASVSISSASPTGTFTYTAASAGAKTISVTNGGALTNPANITYTASAGPLYVRVDATDPIAALNIMVLAPGSGAANPYNSANPTNVILYAHGMGEDQTGLVTEPLKTSCVTALLNAGYILAGSAASALGTQGGIDGIVGLEKYLRDNYNVKNVALWSQSAGGPTGLLALAQGSIKVVGWLGTYPVCDLANFNTVGSYTGSVTTAYGITGTGTGTYANKTYGHDPVLRQGFSFRHVPMRFYASYADTIVARANHTDVMAAIVAGSCRESTVITCTGDHGDPSHFIPSDYAAFFARCFATPVAMRQPVATKAVNITLTSDGTTPRANLTGLKWSWRDQATPDLGEYPMDKGTGATTNASGVLSLAVHSGLATGGVGWLVVTDSDGTTTQNPVAKAFSGPVAVA